MSLKDHLGPKKDWTKKEWLEYAYVQKHNPWISDEDLNYWKDKIKDVYKLVHSIGLITLCPM